MSGRQMAQGTVAGRYRVVREVGRGGMGAVWLCIDERLGRHVAVKQVGHVTGETAPDVARAMREARSSARHTRRTPRHRPARCRAAARRACTGSWRSWSTGRAS